MLFWGNYKVKGHRHPWEEGLILKLCPYFYDMRTDKKCVWMITTELATSYSECGWKMMQNIIHDRFTRIFTKKILGKKVMEASFMYKMHIYYKTLIFTPQIVYLHGKKKIFLVSFKPLDAIPHNQAKCNLCIYFALYKRQEMVMIIRNIFLTIRTE